MTEYLIIVVDHKKGIVGSRHVSRNLDTYDGWNEAGITAYLKREFPGLDFDDVLIIDSSLKIVEEWFRGITRVHG